MEYQKYFVQQFKRKVFKCVPKKLRKNAMYLNIFTYNFKLYHLTICLPEDERDNYKKYKWKKPVLNIGYGDKVDIILNFNYKDCELILNENCKPNNKYGIISNLFTLSNDVYQL
jgi:hypothetical protein